MGVWLLTPRVGGFYAFEWIDGYSESGGEAGATVASQDIGVAEGHVELALSRMVMANARFTGRGGYLPGPRPATTASTSPSTAPPRPSRPTPTTRLGPLRRRRPRRRPVPGSAVFEIGGSAFFGDDVSGYQGNASLGVEF